jgi:hypothetical protein
MGHAMGSRGTGVGIRTRIKAGTFSQPELFPATGKDGQALTVGARLGDRPLHRLKPAQLLKAFAFRPDLNAKTVNNDVTVLRPAMDLAVANCAMDHNLVRSVGRRDQRLPFRDPFHGGEVEAIVDHMAREHPAPIANFVESKLFTGMRRPRACGTAML